jgi:hypothetical protein
VIENFSDPEEEYFSPGDDDISSPPEQEVQRVIFIISYLFADLWNDVVDDIYDNGYNLGGMHFPTEDMLYAIRTGLFIPIYSQGMNEEEAIFFKMWSPLEHKYCDLNEMSIYELYWFFHFLAREDLESN